MLSKRNLLLFFAITFFAISNAQETYQESSKLVSKEYDRCALTLLWNNYQEDSYYQMKEQAFKKCLLVPDKYDKNELSGIQLSLDNELTKMDFSSNASKKIKNLVEENFIPSKIIAFWFNQQEDGSFKMDRIAERGQYNATIEDIDQAMLTKRGLNMIQDAGLNLIDKSHILIFDVTNIKTMAEVAKARGSKADDGQNTILGNSMNPAKKNGYKGDVKLYLYKIDFTDSIASIFYNNYWVNESDDAQRKSERKEALSTFKFPLSFVMEFSVTKSGDEIKQGYAGAPSRAKSSEELFTELVASGISSLIEEMERTYGGCAVKSRLKTVKPKITADIGRKEGVFVDQRYFVYEDVMKGNTIVSKRRGVIRAKTVADNRKMASTDNVKTIFYQTGGGKLNTISMFMAQENDLGIGISAGYSSGAFSGGILMLEYNVSQLIDKASKSNIKSGIKIYGKAGINFADEIYPDAATSLSTPATDDSYTFTYLSAGFAKEIYFLHHFQLTPYLGYEREDASWTDVDDETQGFFTHGMELGSRFGINLYHNIQLCYSANLHFPFFYVDEDEIVSNEDASYTDIFEKRAGLSHVFQLRIIF